MKTINHLTEEEIALCSEVLSKGSLDQVDERLRKHLNDCTQCAGEVMMVVVLANETEEVEFPKKKSVKIWIYASMLAAATVLTFLIVNIPDLFKNENSIETGLSQVDSEKNQQKTIIPSFNNNDAKGVVDSISIADKKTNTKVDKSASSFSGEEIAMFTPNKDLEKLVENMQVSYRDDDITILSKSTSHYPKDDSLRWENSDNQSLTVEWYNNQNKIVKTYLVDNEGVAIPEFENGIYYWKLINEDYDLLGVGKVIINKK